MRYVTRLSAVVAVLVLAGCRENTPVQPRELTPLNALLFDGSTNGNPHVFFLPPLVSNPSTNGTFNPNLAPFVEACQLTADPRLDTPALKAVCAQDVSGATIFALPPTRMTRDNSNSRYQYNWDTKSSLLVATNFYRIIIRGSPGSAIPLAFVDVDPVLGGMKNVKTNDIVQFQDGRTLPISVRIENGAFGGGTVSNDFVEAAVPNLLPATGLDVTTSTRSAGAHFTNDWIPRIPGTTTPITDQVVVIIERLPINSSSSNSSSLNTRCLNSGLEQLEGCYRYRTEPDLHTLIPRVDPPFNADVVVGICFQFPNDIGNDDNEEHPFEIYRSEETLEGLAPATPLLNEKPVTFLDCSNFGPTPPSIGAAFRSGRLGDMAKAGLFAVTHALGRVLEPKSLHAVDLGAGGSTDGFSHFGYVRPAFLSVTAGNGALAPAGSTIQATVHVANMHHGVSTNAVGVPVTFTATAGGTVVESQPVLTDGSGDATVHWRLALGPNTLQVTASAFGSPATIAATGTPVTNTTIDFETYPGGAATCANCSLTNEYSSQGVVFSFAPLAGVASCATFTNAQLFLSSSAYDPVGGDANHSVTSAGLPAGGFCSGTVSMNFASLPDTIRFQLRGNNDIAVFPVAAFDGNGNAIPASAIDRSNVSTYTSVSGFTFRQETITIINEPGSISRIDLGMNGFLTLVDNLIILYPTPIL